MGIGDWGLGIGDWGLGPIPNPQSPIPHPQTPNPQSPIPNPQSPSAMRNKILIFIKITKKIYILIYKIISIELIINKAKKVYISNKVFIMQIY